MISETIADMALCHGKRMLLSAPLCSSFHSLNVTQVFVDISVEFGLCLVVNLLEFKT
jgi:hypothetical protein